MFEKLIHVLHHIRTGYLSLVLVYCKEKSSAPRDILELLGPLIYVCHNSARGNLSTILQETMRSNTNTSKIAKTNYHPTVEEYDGETLSYDEEITELVKGSGLMKSNIISLAQPLIKNKSWNISKTSYEKETCIFMRSKIHLK